MHFTEAWAGRDLPLIYLPYYIPSTQFISGGYRVLLLAVNYFVLPERHLQGTSLRHIERRSRILVQVHKQQLQLLHKLLLEQVTELPGIVNRCISDNATELHQLVSVTWALSTGNVQITTKNTVLVLLTRAHIHALILPLPRKSTAPKALCPQKQAHETVWEASVTWAVPPLGHRLPSGSMEEICIQTLHLCLLRLTLLRRNREQSML